MNMGRRESYDREKLLAYAAGELSVQDAAAIEAYLAQNSAAREFVTLYRSVVETMVNDASVEPPIETIQAAKAIFNPIAVRRPSHARPTWMDSLRQLVATLTFDSRFQPALAGYRGGSTGFELGFTSAAGDIDLQAEPVQDDRSASRDTSRWRLIGQVSPNESAANQSMPDVAVALVRRDGAETDDAASADADEHGVFSIQAEPGRYDMHVRIGDTVVVVQDVRIE